MGSTLRRSWLLRRSNPTFKVLLYFSLFQHKPFKNHYGLTGSIGEEDYIFIACGCDFFSGFKRFEESLFSFHIGTHHTRGGQIGKFNGILDIGHPYGGGEGDLSFH